jgi:hypothetical protein
VGGPPGGDAVASSLLHALLEPFFRNGLVVDGLEETAFTDPSNARGPLSWDHYPEIPPVLVVRLRRP